MKVLLIQPPSYCNGQRMPPSFFPLGLGYVAKSLSKSGHDVEVLDIWAHGYTDKQVVQRTRQTNWDVVGISALSTQYAYVKRLAAELKECNPKKKIVVGGALATHSPEIVLRNTEVDICVIGEGEITSKEILANPDKLENIKGICFKQDGEIVKNPPREYIQDLDSIEFPAWDLFPMDIYIANSHLPGYPNIKAMWVLAGRGCPYNCRYCSKTFTRIRLRSVDNIVAQIKEFTRKYERVKAVEFLDEIFILDKRKVYQFCDGIAPLNIKWACEARVNHVDLELLRHMRKSGCVSIGYGIESGSQSILDRMNKKATVEQAEKAIRDTIKAGIRPAIQMMYGYSGETRETLRETIDFFKRLPYLSIDTIGMARLARTTPLPGSALYEETLKAGLIENEDKYLQSLSQHTSGSILSRVKMLPGLNLTEFTEEEFCQLKVKTENEIFWGNIRRHPFHFAIDCPSHLFSALKRIATGVTRAVS